MKRIASNKLSLRQETIRVLDDLVLRVAAGGRINLTRPGDTKECNTDTNTSVMDCNPTSNSDQH